MPRRVDYSSLVVVGSLKPAYYDRTTWTEVEELEVQLKGSFSADGLAPAIRTGGQPERLGYVDKMGHFVIQPAFRGAGGFSEGRAVVENELGTGMIDTVGHWVVAPGKYDWVSACREQRCSFKTKQQTWGFLDRDGREVIPAIYKGASDFAEGLALVYNEKGEDSYIDANGRVRIMARKGACFVAPFSQGLAEVWFFEGDVPDLGRRGDHRVGFIDRNGEVVIKPDFASADDFSEGLAAASLTDTEPPIGDNFEAKMEVLPESRWGFIDTSGRVVIPMTYEKAGNFREGMARFLEKGKWGYLDRLGNVAIPARFDKAGNFRNGLARVVVKGKEGYINHAGTTVLMTDIDYLTW